MKFLKKRILVTGASGFIGSALCRRLESLNAEVHAVSRRPRTSSDSSIHWWEGDLALRDRVLELVGGIRPEIIFHLASEVTGKRDLELVAPTLSGNLLSTVHLLEAATKTGCQRLVLAGSLEEPGQDTPNAIPSSPYAAAKWAGSGYARMFHALYGTPVVNARLFMVYGPGQQDRSKLIPYVSLCIHRGERPKLASGGRLVDWIFVEDVVDGLLACGTVGGLEGMTLDFGSGDLVTTGEIAEMLCGLAGGKIIPELGAVSDRPMEQVRRANIEETHARTGWSPGTPLETGLRKTAEWYWSHANAGLIT